MTLEDVLKERAESPLQRELLFYPLGNTSTPTRVSYARLCTQARGNAKVLQSMALFREGQPVLLHMHDYWDTILWFWSVRLAKGLPALSTPFSNVDDYRKRHIQGLSALLETSICIMREESLPLFEGTDHNFQLHTIESLEYEADNARPEESEAQANGLYSGKDHGTDSDPQAPAMLMLTSGSTGNAKAVVLTHKQVLASVAGKSAACALPPNRPFLNWVGLDHVGALIEIHMHALWADVDQVHVHAANVISSPTTFLDLLSRHRVSRSFAPNFFLASLVSAATSATQLEGDSAPHRELEETGALWDLSSLTFLVSGGEANDIKTCVEVSTLLEKYGARRGVVAPGFGMTETCAGAIYNTECPEYDVASGYSIASLGKCIKGMEMRVTVPGSGQVLATRVAQLNEPGDLEVRGDVVFQGYYRNPAATAEAFTADGWFRTGDRGMLDINGNLSLVGRVKEVVNINGVKVAVADIQSSLERAIEGRGVARLIVFPSRAAHTEQITVAYVPRTWSRRVEDIAEIEHLLVQACMMAVTSRPLIFALSRESLPLLPTTTLGKISRAKMRSLFEEGAFAADIAEHCSAVDGVRLLQRNEECGQQKPQLENPAMSEAEADLINDFVRTRGGSDPTATVDVNTPVWELGFTSMDLVRLKHRIDTRLHISVPIIVLMKHPTARSLAAALAEHQHQPVGPGKIEDTSSTAMKDDEAAPAAIATRPVARRNGQYDPVVTFRAGGSKTPLWLVHPGVGEVLVFVGLVQHLSDDDRPVYALRARGFEPGGTRFESINQAVDVYVAAIRQRQSQGPYALAGYSYGAMLAFEIAKRLPDGQVHFLGSFNLPPHIKMRMRQLNWNMCLLNLAYFLGLISEEHAGSIEQEGKAAGEAGEATASEDGGFRSWCRSRALARIMSAADQARLWELGLGEKQLTEWADVAHGLQRMAIDYEPAGQVDGIDVFHAVPLRAVAASRQLWLRDHLSRWRDFCRTEPRFHAVGGAHYTMIGPDHVGGFTQILKEALKARGV
ncbi:hypothetical protein DL769_005899 [Monosporascus sp. CRB-8-3]|nr:hypothetical protein DL769_005899 [Monosporascus sp. CRB-8-3]